MERGFRRYRSLLGGLAALAILAAIFWVNAELKLLDLKPVGTPAADLVRLGQTWLGTAALLVAFLILLGVAINKRPAGILIDNRNRVSLSKFQAAVWTVVILSALITSASARIAAAPNLETAIGVLAFHIPPELLGVMGIALTSLVATPALLNNKTEGAQASAQTVTAQAQRTGRDPGMMTQAGSVVGWLHPSCAQWMDMFRGDEDSNFGAPDLSKVQQFLITLTLVGVFGAAIWAGFTVPDPKTGVKFLQGVTVWLPGLDSNFIWLLGISHAGYLAYKAAPHGRPTPEPANPAATPKAKSPPPPPASPPPASPPPPGGTG